MSVAKLFLERVETLGLLDEKVLGQLRKQVADAKGPVTAETLAKVLVDNGHLTVFQAKKLVGDVTAAIEEARANAGAKPAAPPSSAAQPSKRPPEDEFSLADDEDGLEVLEEATETPSSQPPVLGAGDLELLDDSDGLELLEDDPPPKPIAPQKPVAKTPPAAPPSSQAKVPTAAKAGAPASSKLAASAPATGKQALAKPSPSASGKQSTPAAPAASAAGQAAKKPAAAKTSTPSAKSASPLNANDDLTPLGSGDLEVLDDGLSPLDDALGGDSLFGATEMSGPLAAPKKPGPQGSAAKKHANQWDSALIYVGGGGLLVLVFAFVVLYFSLSRGSANEAFQLAEEDFKAQSYEQAIGKYEHYLGRYGDSDSNASLARVRVGVAQIRMAVDNSKDTAEALAVTKETIERIEAEEAFDEARAELADVLPAIAEKLASQAKRSTGDVEKAAVLVGHADDALALVNNGSYIPPSLRQPVEPKVAAIQEDIAVVKREINQDKELRAAVKAMNEATVAGQTTTATELRRAFLKKYPGLDLNEQVVAATLAIAKKEQELVSVTKDALAPVAPMDSPIIEIALVDRATQAPTDGPGTIVAATLQGAVYGVDAGSGRVMWRRYLGLESLSQPTAVASDAGADALIIDKKHNDLLRLKNDDGSIAWRLSLGESFARPTIVGDKALVSTAAGRIVEVDLNTGESARQAKLPQGAVQSAAFDPSRPHIYQLGEHSNLFVLSCETLECREVFFLGHLPGGIAAPPVATGGQVFICNNVGSDYSFVHILSADAQGTNLSKKRDPVRLKGRVVTSPIIDGRRVYVFTDLGAVHVFDVDPANINTPVTDVARLVATRKEPLVSYAAVSEGRVWVSDERMTLYELNPARQELTRKWSRFDGEVFLAPPLPVRDALLVARLRRNVGDIAISAVGPGDGAAKWRTSVGTPVRAIAAGDNALAINANGSVFPLPSDKSSVADASARLQLAGDPPSFSASWNVDDKVLLAPRTGDAQWALVAAAMKPPKTAVIKAATTGATLTAQPIAFEGGVLLPLNNGQVVLGSVLSGKPILLPFQPRLAPGESPSWQTPLALRGLEATFAIADDRGQLYLGARTEEPQPHLAVSKELAAGSIRSPLAQLDDTLLAVVEKDGEYLLTPYSLPDLTPGEPMKLSSGVAFGPRGVVGGVLLATDKDGLMMIESGLKSRWQVPLEGAGTAGIAALPDGLIALTSRGEVLRIDSDGQIIGRFASERPLAGDPTVIGDTLWCPGADGAVYGVPLSSLKE